MAASSKGKETTSGAYTSRHDPLPVIHKKVDRLKVEPYQEPVRPRPGPVPLTHDGRTVSAFDPTVVDQELSDVHFIDDADPAPVRSKSKKATKRSTKKAKAPKQTKKSAARPKRALRPQCAAVTDDGHQCRNSARLTSKYCASHKGYQPKASGAKATDTKPRVAKAKDTLPARRKTAKKPAGKDFRPQCAAVTPEGKQCRNSARDGSKYCGSHKGYRPKKADAKATDTKPRVAKAKDTAPAKRKAPAKKPATKNARCAAKTADGTRCKNTSRDGSKYCASHKGYRP